MFKSTGPSFLFQFLPKNQSNSSLLPYHRSNLKTQVSFQLLSTFQQLPIFFFHGISYDNLVVGGNSNLLMGSSWKSTLWWSWDWEEIERSFGIRTNWSCSTVDWFPYICCRVSLCCCMSFKSISLFLYISSVYPIQISGNFYLEFRALIFSWAALFVVAIDLGCSYVML